MNFVRVFILGFVCWFFAGSVPFRFGLFASVGGGCGRRVFFEQGYSVCPVHWLSRHIRSLIETRCRNYRGEGSTRGAGEPSTLFIVYKRGL
jgi:hypothetical protein